jgi:hypothetical protein
VGFVVVGLVAAACEAPPDPRRTNFEIKKDNVSAKYDPKTGKLQKIDLDRDKNGKVETFSYWDGTRLDRIEIDSDENGTIDRWEHYENGAMVSVGGSSLGDGVEDTWSYRDAEGLLSRVDSDTDRDGVVDKRELFVPRPGTPGGRVLSVVELEIDKSGHPARRLHYKTDGNFERVEVLR